MKTDYTEILINKPKLLKDIISQTLSIDISLKTREQPVVEARFIYFYILREKEGLTLQNIGNTLELNHATVLHGFKKAAFWIEQDYDFAQKYITCLSNYYKEVYDINKDEEIIELKRKLNAKRTIQVEQVYEQTKRPMKRINEVYNKLHILIDKTPEEKAEDLLTRVQAIYNMMQMDLKRKRI